MTQALSQEQITQLQNCLALSKEFSTHDAARQAFATLRESLVDNPAAVALLDALSTELLAARRSSAFWQEMSDVEKGMSDRLTENHIQLQQNYLRLVQEQ